MAALQVAKSNETFAKTILPGRLTDSYRMAYVLHCQHRGDSEQAPKAERP